MDEKIRFREETLIKVNNQILLHRLVISKSINN